MGLILRLQKGSALTYSELDTNFTYLDQSISSSVYGTIGTIPVFTADHTIGDSVIKQVGTSITVNNDPIVLSSQTGSFATTGSNIFRGDQTIIGKITAQTLIVETVTSSVIYSSGSNLFGDSLSDNQVLSGSTYLVGSGYLNGIPLTALNGTGFVKANGTNISYDNTAFGTVASVAALTIGTTGTDLSSTVVNSTTNPVITLNVPTANATNRGVLSSTDWSTFNGKQAALNGTGFVKISGTSITYDNSTYYLASNPNGYTSNTGTVTSVSGTGTVSGLTLSGTVTGTGDITLGGTLSLTSGQVTTALGYTPYNSTNPDGYIMNKNDTYTSTAKITDIITLTAAEYAAIGSPSSNVLYVII